MGEAVIPRRLGSKGLKANMKALKSKEVALKGGKEALKGVEEAVKAAKNVLFRAIGGDKRPRRCFTG